MPLGDHRIGPKRWQSRYIQAADFSSVKQLSLTLTEGAPNTVSSNAITSFTTGNPTVVNINSTNLTGVQFGTAGHVIRHVMPLPRDWDTTKDIYVRALYTTGSATTTDGVTWKVFFKNLSLDSDAITGTINTALGTVIAADTVIGAYKLQQSPPGKISANTLTKDLLELEVEMDASDVDLAAEGVYLLGIEFAYVARITDQANDDLTRLSDAPWS